MENALQLLISLDHPNFRHMNIDLARLGNLDLYSEEIFHEIEEFIPANNPDFLSSDPSYLEVNIVSLSTYEPNQSIQTHTPLQNPNNILYLPPNSTPLTRKSICRVRFLLSITTSLPMENKIVPDPVV